MEKWEKNIRTILSWYPEMKDQIDAAIAAGLTDKQKEKNARGLLKSIDVKSGNHVKRGLSRQSGTAKYRSKTIKVKVGTNPPGPAARVDPETPFVLDGDFESLEIPEWTR